MVLAHTIEEKVNQNLFQAASSVVLIENNLQNGRADKFLPVLDKRIEKILQSLGDIDQCLCQLLPVDKVDMVGAAKHQNFEVNNRDQMRNVTRNLLADILKTGQLFNDGEYQKALLKVRQTSISCLDIQDQVSFENTGSLHDIRLG